MDAIRTRKSFNMIPMGWGNKAMARLAEGFPILTSVAFGWHHRTKGRYDSGHEI
jgi:hypothetical protein